MSLNHPQILGIADTATLAAPTPTDRETPTDQQSAFTAII